MNKKLHEFNDLKIIVMFDDVQIISKQIEILIFSHYGRVIN